MKKNLFLVVCLTAVFAINYAKAQKEYNVTTPGGSTGYIPIWNNASGTTVTSIGVSSLYNTNGKIGIGTNNPTQKLHLENGSLLINGNTNTDADLIISRTGNINFPSLNLINTGTDPEGVLLNTNFKVKLDLTSAFFQINNPYAIGTPTSTEMEITTERVNVSNSLSILNRSNSNVSLTVSGNSNFSGNMHVSERMTINSNDAVIELNNPTNTPPIVPSNFQIIASNGTGRLSSDGDVCIFLDRENTHTGEFFNVYTNGNYVGGSSVLLFQVKQAETSITNDLKIGENVRIYADGKMWVKNEIAIQNGNPWADYVFAPDYNLKSLSEVEAYIKAYKHLPGIPSASEIEANGIKLGEMTNLLTQKIEELTLYTIELQKQVDALKKQANNK